MRRSLPLRVVVARLVPAAAEQGAEGRAGGGPRVAARGGEGEGCLAFFLDFGGGGAEDEEDEEEREGERGRVQGVERGCCSGGEDTAVGEGGVGVGAVEDGDGYGGCYFPAHGWGGAGSVGARLEFRMLGGGHWIGVCSLV